METKQPESIRNQRRPKAHMSTVATNLFHLRNPWVTAWWSAAFPGFGHIMLGSYIKGFLLVIWELLINVESKLNLCIMYTLTGQFQQAREIVDIKWLLLYGSVYIFAIWDGYRETVELNKLSILADREDSIVLPVKIDAFETNHLEKKYPWIAVAWSLLMPGIGHLYTHRIPTSFFVLAWWVLVTYMSNLLPGIHNTLVGGFVRATEVINIQWLLFLPSMYAFAFYDAYVNCVEYNRLFEIEMRRFLRDNYQAPGFAKPV